MPRVKIGGFPAIGRKDCRWKFSIGHKPVLKAYEMHRSFADELFANNDGLYPITLEVDDWKVEKLVLVKRVPSDHRHIDIVVLADWRWLLKSVWCGPRRYNWKRRTGNRRWLVKEGRFDNALLEDEIQYVDFSLQDDKTPWQGGHDIVVDVMNEILAKVNAIAPQFGVKLLLGTDLRTSLPIQGIFLDYRGDVALAKLSTLLVETNWWVDANGDLATSDTMPGRELAVLRGGGWVIGSSLPNLVDRSRSRPKKVRIYFTREHELRIRTRKENKGAPDDDDPLVAANVCQVVEESLTVNGKKLPYGTPVEIDDLIGTDGALWGQTRANGDPLENLTHAKVQALYAWEALEIYYSGKFYGLAFDPTWRRRVKQIKESYRQRFRINPQLMGRTLDVKAHMATVLNPFTGERAFSPIFSDYAVRLAHNGIDARSQGEQKIWDNFFGYDPKLSECKAANGRTIIEDPDLGIFRYAYLDERWGGVREIMPGNVTTASNPSVLPDHILSSSNEDGPNGVIMQEDWRSQTILTFTPAAPQGTGQLYYIEVDSQDPRIEEAIGRPVGKCLGPEYAEIRINRGLMQARFAWADFYEEQIKQAYLGGNAEAIPDFDSLLANRDELQNLAVAKAAEYLAQHLDQVQGTGTLAGHVPVVLTGNLRTAEYGVQGTTGARTTTVEMPTRPFNVPFEAMIDDDTAVLLRLQIPQRGF